MRVVIESPFSSDDSTIVERNVLYARYLLLQSYLRGQAPIASHLLGPQVLDDNEPDERAMGMHAGWAWMRHAEGIVVGIDFGISAGMKSAIERAKILEIPAAYYLYGFKDHKGVCSDIQHAIKKAHEDYRPPDMPFGYAAYGDPARVDPYTIKERR